MTTKKATKTNLTLDLARKFLEDNAKKAGLKGFTLNKAFTYKDTLPTTVEGNNYENVLFTHTVSKREICVSVLAGKVDAVSISDSCGSPITDDILAKDITKNPKKWFKEYLTPKKFSCSVSLNFSIPVEVEAFDEDEARDLLEEKACATFRTADIDGIDACAEDIDVA